MRPPARPRTDSIRPPARDRYDLKMEIDSAQHDLERSLHELKDVLVDKIDLRARLDQRIEATKATALDLAVRGRDLGLDVAARTRTLYRDQPLVVLGVIGGLLLVTGLALTIRHELHATA